MKILALTVACSLFTTPTFAGPDDTTTLLMNNYPSLLDFGIFKLEKALNTHSDKYGNTLVSYNWDANNIEISQFVFDHGEPRNIAEDSCNTYVDYIRDMAAVVDGKALAGISTFAGYFGHAGYSINMGGKEESEVQKELDKKFYIKYIIGIENDSGSIIGSLTCTAKLLGTTVAIEYSFNK